MGNVRVMVDEPHIATCTLSLFWWIACAVIGAACLVLLAIPRRARWHIALAPAILAVAPLGALVAWALLHDVVSGVDDVGSIFPSVAAAVDRAHVRIFETIAAALAAIYFGTLLVALKKIRAVRVAGAIAASFGLVAFGACVYRGREANAATAALNDVGDVVGIDIDWPAEVHVGQTFSVVMRLPLLEVRALTSIFMHPRQWEQNMNAYTATAVGPYSVVLAITRGPVRAERIVTGRAVRDDGPPWMPLAVGNTWQLVDVVGPDGARGAVQRAFDRGDATGDPETLRVASEKFDGGLHTFELVLDGPHHRSATLHRRDGELAGEDGKVIVQNAFPMLGACRFASAPIDAARTLAGPTICNETRHTRFFGGEYEEGVVLARSSASTP